MENNYSDIAHVEANNKKNKGEKGEYAEFRVLLRKGIGTRTQADFAKEIGWAPSRINTFLKPKLIARPTVFVLRTLAKHMTAVTLDELLISCGYEAGVETAASDILFEMKEYFGGKNGQTRIFRNFLDALQAFSANYNLANISKLKLSVAGQGENTSRNYPEAEKEQYIDVNWRYMNQGYHMAVTIYFLQTLSGKTLTFGVEAKRNENGRLVSRCESECLMGDTAQYVYVQELKNRDTGDGSDEMSTRYQAVFSGPGMRYDKTPPLFNDFLERHKDTFCINDERTALWTRVVNCYEDPDAVFSNFGDGSWNNGTGAVVANIITDELRNLPELDGDRFVYVRGDESDASSNNSDNSYVMIIQAPKGARTLSKEMEEKLYDYAKELGVPSFGICYYKTIVRDEPSLWFKTDTYYQAVDYDDSIYW